MENSTISVTLKTLQEDIFTVETDPCQTVKNFKIQISRVKGPDYPAEEIRLLFGGKFLLDNKRLCDYHIQARNFVILVLRKEIQYDSEDSDSDDMPSYPSSPSPERVAYESTVARTDIEVLRFIQYQDLVCRIVELGFTREQATSALNVGCNNPDRAVDYLVTECLPCCSGNFNGIDIDACAPRLPWDTVQACARIPNPEMSNLAISSIFANAIMECRTRTRLQDYAIEQEAELITRSYEQMEAAHRQALGNNPRARLPPNALEEEYGEDAEDVLVFDFDPTEVWSSSWGFRALRDCDHQAIDRLKRLGRFSTRNVVKAYFLCNRNEKAAAQYLITKNFRC